MNTVKLKDLNNHFSSIEKQKTIKINDKICETVSKINNFMDKYHKSLFISLAFLSLIAAKLCYLSFEYSFLFYAAFMSVFLIPILAFFGVKRAVDIYNQKTFYCLPADKETMVKFVAIYDDIESLYLENLFLKHNNLISYNIILNEIKRNMGQIENEIKKEKTHEIIKTLKNTKQEFS